MDIIKILVIENETNHISAIKGTLERHLGERVKVYPQIINGKNEDFSNNNYLLGEIINGKFNEILEHYSDIDLFIIDVYLRDTADEIGLLFYQHILKNVKREFKAIIMSNNKINVDLLINGKAIFFSKYDKGIKNFPLDLVKVVRNIFPFAEKEIVDPRVVLNEELTSVNNNFYYKLHEFWEWLRDNINRTLDKLIFLIFYILLLATTIFAVIKILSSMLDSIPYFSNDTVKKDVDETLILKTSEHIFLYLLPVFIVFGFFNYYKNNSRILLLDGIPDSNDQENSTKTMNLTKILFISSIISYVSIKVIEELFFLKTTDFLRLFSFGSFLVLLMTYFIFLDRKH